MLNILKNELAKFIKRPATPDFLIIGAQKSGTSSLFQYLNQHPRLQGSKEKEIHFFDRDERYKKGEEWYQNFFRKNIISLQNRFLFEATPVYLYRRGCAERIYRYDPGLKLIAILRNPVDRAFSAWNMYRDLRNRNHSLLTRMQKGYVENSMNNLYAELMKPEEFPSFEECIEREIQKIENHSELQEPSLLRRGIYIDQIKEYLNYFDKDQLLILEFQEFIRNTKLVLNEVLTFLNLPESEWKFVEFKEYNSRHYPINMKEDTKKFLTKFYEKYNKKLFKYINKKINW